LPRPRQRACLEEGLKLDLNKLIRRRLVVPGCTVMSSKIRWHLTYTGEEAAIGTIAANMESQFTGWLRIEIEELVQTINLQSEARHFGGRQWYFVCPETGRRVSVIWKPLGATRFASRQAWRPQVAYTSQFQDGAGRAHLSKAKIHSKLCKQGCFNPDEWEFPPKPKWMRWKTYHRAEENFDRHDATLDKGIATLLTKLGI
jgi:hypothetical protein